MRFMRIIIGSRLLGSTGMSKSLTREILRTAHSINQACMKIIFSLCRKRRDEYLDCVGQSIQLELCAGGFFICLFGRALFPVCRLAVERGGALSQGTATALFGSDSNFYFCIACGAAFGFGAERVESNGGCGGGSNSGGI